jgi:hypothetical protein
MLDVASDAVGAASAAIKIRGAPYFIAPEGAPTEAFHFFVLIQENCEEEIT